MVPVQLAVGGDDDQRRFVVGQLARGEPGLDPLRDERVGIGGRTRFE